LWANFAQIQLDDMTKNATNQWITKPTKRNNARETFQGRSAARVVALALQAHHSLTQPGTKSQTTKRQNELLQAMIKDFVSPDTNAADVAQRNLRLHPQALDWQRALHLCEREEVAFEYSRCKWLGTRTIWLTKRSGIKK
jgi:hypothetical protein